MRKLIPVVLWMLCVASCRQNKETPSNFLYLVPQNAAAIVKADQLSAWTATLSENDFVDNNENLPLIQFFKDAYGPLNQLDISKNSLLFFSRIGRDEVATSLITPLRTGLLDNFKAEQVDHFSYGGETVKVYQKGEQKMYAVQLNGFWGWSDSKLVVENIIRLANEHLEPEEELQRLYRATSNRKPALLLNLGEFQKIYQQSLPQLPILDFQKATDWVALDLDVDRTQMRFNGIALPERNTLLGIFKNTTAQKNELEKITPVNANGLISFTYNDFQTLKDNLSFYRKEDVPKMDTDLLDNASEVGVVYTPQAKVIAVNPKEEQRSAEFLKGKLELEKKFREHEIFKFSQPDYFNLALDPLIPISEVSYYTELGGFLLFAQNVSALEYMIANHQSGKVLGADELYKLTQKRLDGKSSILAVGISESLVDLVADGVAKKYKKAYQDLQLAHRPYVALQFINHSDYTYINAVFEKTSSAQNSATGTQLKSIKPGEKIGAGPWFFEHWNTHHHDIVFQGESHTLYSYNEDGKLNWKKKLDGPILGDIQPIDIYQNKRIQMAFVTPRTFYIIDRLGNVVKPYEMHFNDLITQPLAVFDYSNNGRFRFLIIQDREVLMLDKALQKVEGFEFVKAKSSIVQAPRHYRVGNKDYLLIPEESGHLNILNPRGQTRLDVKERLSFSSNPWFLYHNQFTSTSSKGELLQVNTAGKLSKTDLKLDAKNKMAATAQTLVTFSENKLRIKDQTVTLDFGLYTAPQIFYIADKILVGITDLQAHRVYVFDSDAKPLDGFPVYGNSIVDIQNMDNQGGLELVVKGEDDSVLIYQVN